MSLIYTAFSTLALILLLAIPATTIAAECPNGYQEYGVWSAGEAQSKLKELTEKSDLCSDEAIILIASGYVCHRITPNNALPPCKPKENRCEPRSNPPPIVRVTMPKDYGGKTLVFSKCDKNALGKAIDETARTGSISALEKYAALSAPRIIPPGQSMSVGDLIKHSSDNPESPTLQKAAQNPALKTAVVNGEPTAILRVAREAGLSEVEAQTLAAERALVRPAAAGPLSGLPENGVRESAFMQELSPAYSGGVAGNSGYSNLLSGVGSMLSSFLQGPSAPPTNANHTNSASSQGALLSAATLVIQPGQYVRGGALLVSWSSVGMGAKPPCTLSISASPVQEVGNEGSTKIAIPLHAADTLSIVLACTTADGQRLERQQSVSIH